jgi:hypothetical protein
MTSSTRTQQRYDHRLRRLIQTTGDLDLAVSHGVPRSMARGWLKNSGIAGTSEFDPSDTFSSGEDPLEGSIGHL